jgi:endonuclease-3
MNPSSSRKRSKVSAAAADTTAAATPNSTLESDAALAALFTQVRQPRARANSNLKNEDAAAVGSSQSSTAAAEASPKPSSAKLKQQKRKHVPVEVEQAGTDASMPPLESPDPAEKTAASATAAAQAETGVPAPKDWQRVYAGIEEMRFRGIARNAPVDTVGCERLHAKDADDKTRRFHTLVSLMLSSQTKDPVTAQAMANLHAHWKDGLTVQNMIAVKDATLDSLICKVGLPHSHSHSFLRRCAFSLLLISKFVVWLCVCVCLCVVPGWLSQSQDTVSEADGCHPAV